MLRTKNVAGPGFAGVTENFRFNLGLVRAKLGSFPAVPAGSRRGDVVAWIAPHIHNWLSAVMIVNWSNSRCPSTPLQMGSFRHFHSFWGNREGGRGIG